MATTTTLGATASPVVGQPVTYTATVAPARSGTTVAFTDNGVAIAGCTAQPLSTAGVATCVVTYTAPGSHPIVAGYGGTTGFDPSTSTKLTETVGKASTTTTVTSTANPSVFGQALTLTATVAAVAPGAGIPSGTVTFAANGVVLGTGTLSGQTPDQATLTSAALLPGSHQITASYGGDADFLGSSTTTPVGETVGCTRTISASAGALTVTSGATCVTAGARVAGSITVEPGAALSVTGALVGGSIKANGAGALAVCGSTVGSLAVQDASGAVLLGTAGDQEAACAANTVQGTVTLSGNQGGVELSGNTIGGTVQVTDNAGSGPLPEDTAPELENNQIAGRLVCSGNSPAPTDDGQPNRVTGARSGQCAAPGF